MKLYILLAVVFILGINCSISAQGINFENADWTKIKELAKESNKPIFVDTYASWCEPCKWMDENTFSKPEVGTFFEENYVSYKVNIEKGEGATFAQNYQVTSFPTLLYFDANGELTHRMIGAFKPNDLIEKSEAALLPENQIYTLQKQFEKGERNSSFLYKYAFALKTVNEDYSEVVNLYLEGQEKESLVEEKNFEFLEIFVNDYNHPIYSYVLTNKATFVADLGVDRVEGYLDAAFKIRCYELIENASEKSIVKEFLQDVKRILPSRVDYFKTRIDFYYNRGEKKDYRLAKKYEKHCKDSKSLDGLARYMLDMYGSSKSHLNSALEWSEKAILLEENAFTLETKAMILLALDRKEEALSVAEKQLALSKKTNNYIKESEAFIDRIKKG